MVLVSILLSRRNPMWIVTEEKTVLTQEARPLTDYRVYSEVGNNMLTSIEKTFVMLIFSCRKK